MEARLTDIRRDEALRYIGVRGAAPADIDEALTRAIALLMRSARPRVLWRRYDRLPDGTLAGTGFRPAGEDIRVHLRGCGGVVLMAATLGTEIERLIGRMQLTDPADALVLDACASAAVENVCDNLCADIAAALAPAYLTARFSPGYGDLPLTQQADLFRALDVTRRIGVTLTDSGLMLPQKSVTALLGVSDAPIEGRARGCGTCALYPTCAYRKDGKTCETI